ncbi:MAG: hypothetical protein WBL40_21275, partial [Terrimicrobiaceae bacterium]
KIPRKSPKKAFFSAIRGLSDPGDVAKLFSRAGYREVKNYANTWSRCDAKHLKIAGQYVAAGYKVVLSIDYRVLEKAKQDSDALVATMNHWVGLTTPITFDATEKFLAFKVFSWGKVQSST